MKRFACNKLYITPQLMLPQSVVEVGEGGIFLSHYPLTHEVSHTEWIGGVIFLSGHARLEHLTAEQAWNDFCLQAAVDSSLQPAIGFSLQGSTDLSLASTPDWPAPLYAWHLAPFDFANHCCLPQSRLKRLF